MKVREIMHGITLVDKDSSVLETAKLMAEKDIGSVLTREDGCIKIVTERDILKKVVAKGRDPNKIAVSELMNHCAHTIDADQDVFDASDILNEFHIRRLPVLEEGEIIGIVTARDIAKSLTYVSAKKVSEQWGHEVERSLRGL